MVFCRQNRRFLALMTKFGPFCYKIQSFFAMRATTNCITQQLVLYTITKVYSSPKLSIRFIKCHFICSILRNLQFLSAKLAFFGADDKIWSIFSNAHHSQSTLLTGLFLLPALSSILYQKLVLYS